MARTIPTINTARMTLRAMRPQDFEDYAALWQEPTVVRHMGDAPRTRTHSWRQFLLLAGHWQMAGFGVWGVEPRGTRRIMGQAGFWFAGRELGEDFDAYPEATCVLHPDLHGTGLGREAAQAAHDWFDRVITGPLVCEIGSGNTTALRIGDELGYRPLREHETGAGPQQLMLRKSPPGGRG